MKLFFTPFQITTINLLVAMRQTNIYYLFSISAFPYLYVTANIKCVLATAAAPSPNQPNIFFPVLHICKFIFGHHHTRAILNKYIKARANTKDCCGVFFYYKSIHTRQIFERI